MTDYSDWCLSHKRGDAVDNVGREQPKIHTGPRFMAEAEAEAAFCILIWPYPAIAGE
jgi:hypothetical protein